MGLQDLQEYIETSCPKAAINVELDKVAWRKRGGGKSRVPSGQIVPLFVVLDAESCLHRIYGGAYTDWVCGGQWNQTYQFAAALANSARRLNIELVVFFNGSLEKKRMQAWSRDQMIAKGNVRNILNHIQRKGVPPPRAWFIPPVGLEHCLRLSFQDCGIRVQQSLKDHQREVMSFCRGNVFHGIIGHSADYIVFDPPRYFSSHQLKLSRDGRVITTTQYLLDEVAKQLEIPQSCLPLVATLLGNHILTEEDVTVFQWRLIEPDQPESEVKISHVHLLPPGGTIIPAIAKYVRELSDPEDFDEIAKDVFKNSRRDFAEQTQQLKDSVSYYRSASRNGGRSVMHQRAQKKSSNASEEKSDSSNDETNSADEAEVKDGDKCDGGEVKGQLPEGEVKVQLPESEVKGQLPEGEIKGQLPEGEVKVQLPEGEVKGQLPEGEVKAQLPEGEVKDQLPESEVKGQFPQGEVKGQLPQGEVKGQLPQGEAKGQLPEAKSESSDVSSSSTEEKEKEKVSDDDADDLAEDVKNIKLDDITEKHDESSGSNGIPPLMQTSSSHSDVSTPPVPMVGPEVIRIAEHRHRMGLLHPSILQILTHGEIQIPISIEDDHQLPPVPSIYQPLRQHVYGIIFSIRHMGPTSKRRILIKEWWASKGKLLFTPEITEALPFKDWHVPPLHQLWLGREPEDKNRRMRAFLSCMRCDTPSMLNQSLVPRHALIMCCILRYLMQFPTPLLRRYEIDALLATSVSPILQNSYVIQEMESPNLTQRGVLIASLFMRGVETAMFANDVCGEPVPIMFSAPWHYFDGKLFQIKLAIATQDGSNLVQLCEGRVDQVAKVERMRQAIMEGCNSALAKTPFPPAPLDMAQGYAFMGGYTNMNIPKPPHGGRGPPQFGVQWDHNGNRLPMMFQQPNSSYAQLKVAGYTVGNWAGGDSMPPHLGGYHGGQRGQMMNKGRGMWFGGAGDASTSKKHY